MNKFFIFLMLVAVASSASVVASADSDITVVVNGQMVVFDDQQPVLVDGRTLVSVRGVLNR